jgi:Tol biopolymer transport system component
MAVAVAALLLVPAPSASPTTDPEGTDCGRPATTVDDNGLFSVSRSGHVVRLRPRADGEGYGSLWSPSGRHLALRYQQTDGPSRVVVLDLNGGAEIHPLDQDLSISELAWASDTRLVVAASPWNPGQPSRQRILTVDLDGGPPITLWEDPGDQFSILLAPSPDGRRLVFVGDEWPGKLMIVNLDGSGFRQIADDAYWDFTTPAVAPDGRHLAAVINGQRVIIDADTGEQMKLGPADHSRTTTGPIGGTLGHTPQEAILGWSPTGREVAWRAGDTGEVLFYRADGTRFEVIDEKIVFKAAFLPDGRVVVQTVDRDSDYRNTLHVVGLDGSGRRTLVSRPYNWVVLADAVVFEAGRSDVSDPAVLCWMPYDGSRPRPLAGFRTPGPLGAYSSIYDLGGAGPDGPFVAVPQ